MKVSLPAPASWLPTADRSWLLAGEARIELTPVAPLPDDLVAWTRLCLAEPAPARVELVREQEFATESGWPALLFCARVTESGAATRKLVGLLQILEVGAVFTVRAPEALYLEHEEAILAVFRAARVEWDEGPLTLAAIWAGFSPD